MVRGGGHFCYAGWAEWGELRGGGKRAAPDKRCLVLACVCCLLSICMSGFLEINFQHHSSFNTLFSTVFYIVCLHILQCKMC